MIRCQYTNTYIYNPILIIIQSLYPSYDLQPISEHFISIGNVLKFHIENPRILLYRNVTVWRQFLKVTFCRTWRLKMRHTMKTQGWAPKCLRLWLSEGALSDRTWSRAIYSRYVRTETRFPPSFVVYLQPDGDDKLIKYRGFVLGCTVMAVGLNFASYYYYPLRKANYSIRMDAVRRAGLWSLYGSAVGMVLGRILFQLPWDRV